MVRRSILVMMLVLFGNLPVVHAQPMGNEPCAAMLYSTLDIACHNAGIDAWGDDDVAQMARYLNTLHQHYSTPYSPGTLTCP